MEYLQAGLRFIVFKKHLFSGYVEFCGDDWSHRSTIEHYVQLRTEKNLRRSANEINGGVVHELHAGQAYYYEANSHPLWQQ
jgi:hypothetical protein